MDDISKQTIPDSGKSTQTLINVAVLLLVFVTSVYVVYQEKKLSAGTPAAATRENTLKPPSGNAASLQGLANSLIVSAVPATLDFGEQMTGTTSGVQTVTLTAKPDVSVKIFVTTPTNGDFGVLPSGCDLEPSASCALTVTFTPKHIQWISSSLGITAVATPVAATPKNPASAQNAQTPAATPNKGAPPQNVQGQAPPPPATAPTNVNSAGVISLTGEGTASCPATGPLFPTGNWFISKVSLLVVVLGFLLVLMLVRWHMVAVPTRRLALAAIESVKARVNSLSDPKNPALAPINTLLSTAYDVVTGRYQTLRDTLADYFFWNRGQEIAAWGYVHEAEEQLVFFLPAENVRAALERAESDLRQVGTPPAVTLADRIHDALVAAPALSVEWRPLLKQALGFLPRLDADLTDRVCQALDPKSSATVADCLKILQDAAAALEPTAATKLANQIDAALEATPPEVSTLITLLQQACNLFDPRTAAALATKIRTTLATNPPATIDQLKPILEEIRDHFKPQAAALADSIKHALAAEPVVLPIGRWKALLYEALGFLYDRADTNFSTMISWHNKTIFLVGCGLLLIVSLGAALQHEALFLLGATGGLLSRLTRTLFREDVPTDYGASWTTLFLSPVVGALMGWAGVLLVILGFKFNILGPALDVDWCNPTSPVALALAFLLGFSERAFTGILSQLETKVQANSPTSQPTMGATLSITTPATLPSGKVGEKYTSQPLAAFGGTSPYKWGLMGGQLPAGLSLDPSGQISGTPTAAGTLVFIVQVIDAASNVKSQVFTITVA